MGFKKKVVGRSLMLAFAAFWKGPILFSLSGMRRKSSFFMQDSDESYRTTHVFTNITLYNLTLSYVTRSADLEGHGRLVCQVGGWRVTDGKWQKGRDRKFSMDRSGIGNGNQRSQRLIAGAYGVSRYEPQILICRRCWETRSRLETS
ncbi:hypothetical protein F4805DRAFT_372898 [Annulohypoxylon moriforme]|nr:hypothetical protein F4805DRAFT_372898 [Annulohypoxylon moriforme]